MGCLMLTGKCKCQNPWQECKHIHPCVRHNKPEDYYAAEPDIAYVMTIYNDGEVTQFFREVDKPTADREECPF